MPRFAVASVAACAIALAVSLPAWAITTTYRAPSSLTPDALWAKVGAFCDIQKWLPPVDKCTLSADGRTRTLDLKGGGAVVEQLVSRNERARSYTYRITSSPLPVDHYQSTIRVVPEKGGSMLVWTGTYKAKGASDADAQKVIFGVYQAGAQQLVAP